MKFSMLKRTTFLAKGRIGMSSKSRFIARFKSHAVAILAAIAVGGCAAFDPGPPPLTEAQIIELSKAGQPPAAIIDQLRKTRTVLWLSASDIVKLREAGVSAQVLDYLQAVQFAEMRRRGQFDQLLYGPEMSPFSRCSGLSASRDRFSGYFSPFCL
jgi:hypothetical protein